MLYELIVQTWTGMILTFVGEDLYTEVHDDEVIYYIAGQSFPASVVKQVNMINPNKEMALN